MKTTITCCFCKEEKERRYIYFSRLHPTRQPRCWMCQRLVWQEERKTAARDAARAEYRKVLHRKVYDREVAKREADKVEAARLLAARLEADWLEVVRVEAAKKQRGTRWLQRIARSDSTIN